MMLKIKIAILGAFLVVNSFAFSTTKNAGAHALETELENVKTELEEVKTAKAQLEVEMAQMKDDLKECDEAYEDDLKECDEAREDDLKAYEDDLQKCDEAREDDLKECEAAGGDKASETKLGVAEELEKCDEALEAKETDLDKCKAGEIMSEFFSFPFHTSTLVGLQTDENDEANFEMIGRVENIGMKQALDDGPPNEPLRRYLTGFVDACRKVNIAHDRVADVSTHDCNDVTEEGPAVIEECAEATRLKPMFEAQLRACEDLWPIPEKACQHQGPDCFENVPKSVLDRLGMSTYTDNVAELRQDTCKSIDYAVENMKGHLASLREKMQTNSDILTQIYKDCGDVDDVETCVRVDYGGESIYSFVNGYPSVQTKLEDQYQVLRNGQCKLECTEALEFCNL